MIKLNRKIAAAAITVLATATFIIACSKGGGGGTPDPVNPTGFDKTAMLTNYADNIIIPAYTTLQTQSAALETAVNTFLATPTAANQSALKIVFKDTYLKFEDVSVDQFGPAESALLSNFLNTFPTDSAVVEGNITRGTYDLAANTSINQQGFPALDYLLFNPHAVADFTGAAAANRKKYAQDLVAALKTKVTGVLNGWKNTYRATFIANTRSDSGSPIAFLINQFAFEMDQLKGPRIGWPFGKQSGGTQFPNNTEGFNSGISVALATENLTALKGMYNGAGSGKGMSDYLIWLNKQQLNTDVMAQFDKALNSLRAVPDPYTTSMTTRKTEIEAAYREIQVLLTLIKTDVASATGVRITYQDTDGD
jgi:predicted lipoprotein